MQQPYALVYVLFLWLLVLPCQSKPSTATSKPTPIFIDALPAYKNLASCAERPLNTIVRNMACGCGDNSEMTSFACFCTSSYSKISWDISTAVVSNCGSALAAQATSAVAVFHEYCANGTMQLPPETSTTLPPPTTAATSFNYLDKPRHPVRTTDYTDFQISVMDGGLH